MEYIFSAAAQALQASGQALPVFNAVGQALPLLRDPNTGRFVAMAVQGGTALATGGTVPAVVSVLGSTVGIVMQSQQNRQVLTALSEVQTSLGVTIQVWGWTKRRTQREEGIKDSLGD